MGATQSSGLCIPEPIAVRIDIESCSRFNGEAKRLRHLIERSIQLHGEGLFPCPFREPCDRAHKTTWSVHLPLEINEICSCRQIGNAQLVGRQEAVQHLDVHHHVFPLAKGWVHHFDVDELRSHDVDAVFYGRDHDRARLEVGIGGPRSRELRRIAGGVHVEVADFG